MQNNQQIPSQMPSGQKRQIPLVLRISIIFLIILAVGFIASSFAMLNGIPQDNFLYNFACYLRGGIINDYRVGCLIKTSDGSKECIQNNQCSSGFCKPSARVTIEGLGQIGGTHHVWSEIPKVNESGYVLGSCTDKKSTYQYEDMNIPGPVGCSLVNPITTDQPERVVCVFGL